MKQIEVTVRLTESIKDVIAKIEKQGFEKIREGFIHDIYLSNYDAEMKRENIQEFLKHSVLLRTLIDDGKEIKKITYKNKEFDKNGDVVSEQKINLDYSDLDKAEKLFNCLGFYNLIEVKYNVIVYARNGMEFAIQVVDNLGELIEYESDKDFEEKSILEINNEKIKMVQELKNLGICITDEHDVKKAYELIVKKYKL